MRPFRQVDVFTDRFMLGNPVAVVQCADGDTVADEDLAAFARWTNLSETTFLLPPTDPSADYRLRIFTTARELPFAGHPTLGSARAWLDMGGVPKGARIVQECGAGLVEIRRDGDRLAFAAPPLLRGGPVDPADAARLGDALGLTPADVLDAQWCDNGPGWMALLLRDADTVLRVQPDASRLGEFRDVGVVGAHPAGSAVAFEVRAFVAEPAVWEDPVTGSLNAALAQWLIPAGYAPQRYVAAQGTVLRRRGRVHVERDGDTTWVGGDTVIGISGEVAGP